MKFSIPGYSASYANPYELINSMNNTTKNINVKVSGFCFRKILIFCYLFIFSVITFKANGQAGTGPIVINEVGIGANPSSSYDQGRGGEFIELFNKSGCRQDISCYVLVFSGTSYMSAGWTVTIPSGTILDPGQYYLIGGHHSNLLLSTTWASVPPGNSNTWVNTYNTNGKDLADLDLGRAYTSGKAMIIGNLINNAGQITLFKSNGSIASSVSYNNGNNSGTYPATPNNPPGCASSTIPNPNLTITPPFYNAAYTSFLIGFYLDENGVYQKTENVPNPGNGPTPGKSNNTNLTGSQIAVTPAPTITVQPVSQTDCKGNSVIFSADFSPLGNVTYQWQSSTDGITWSDISASWPNISGASGSTGASPITLNVSNIGVGGSNGVNTNGTQYRVKITDLNGCIIISNGAVLTVNQITGITPQNTQTTLCEGGSFTFTVSTSGSTPISYQWLKNTVPLSNGTVNGVTISGANTATLTVTNASPAESGAYKVDVLFNVIDGSGIFKTCNERSTLTRNVTVNPKPTPIIYHN